MSAGFACWRPTSFCVPKKKSLALQGETVAKNHRQKNRELFTFNKLQQAIISRHRMILPQMHPHSISQGQNRFDIPNATPGITRLQPLIEARIAVTGIAPLIIKGAVKTKHAIRFEHFAKAGK